ncbi:MAG: hypothetical protein KatS3mg035_0010 [Bacteroidia bacterium]|nr:MAG: hypothetical protein KatS3mg035_0010 [Bacteroidia bacterium]
MKKIAFLTLENPTGFVIYDELCIPFFQEKNIQVTQIPWTQKTDWSIFDLVIIRSPWDYQQKWKAFIQVLKQIQNQTCLANPYEVVLWNYQKTYLKELKKHYFEIVDTAFLYQILNEKDFENLQIQLNSNILVIKPQISANADDTYIIKNFSEYVNIAPCFENKPYMIQAYVSTIEHKGEVSLFYFNGHYSHSVIKKPRTGDFRVQEEHGGIISAFEPSKDLIEIANFINNFLNKKWGTLLYARLDFVKHQNIWRIMELELIEPSLYFPYHKDACSNFVNATIKWYQNLQKN